MNRVRLVRNIRNTSLRELAKTVGCSVGTIHAIEEDFNKPNVILAQRISKKLKAHISLLFPDEENEYDDRITYYIQCKADQVKGIREFSDSIEIDWLSSKTPKIMDIGEIEDSFLEDKMSTSYGKYLSTRKGA